MEYVKVHVFKPVTSKPGNSEVYIVAECFKTLGDQWLSVIKSHIGLSWTSNSVIDFYIAFPVPFLNISILIADFNSSFVFTQS